MAPRPHEPRGRDEPKGPSEGRGAAAPPRPADGPLQPERPGADDESNPQPFDLRALGTLDVRSTMVTGLFVLAALYTLYVARAVLMPIAVATLLAILLAPVVNGISRRLRLPLWTSSMLIMVAALALLSAGAYTLSGPATNWARTLPDHLREAQWKARDLLAPMERLKAASDEVERIAGEGDAGDVHSVPVRVKEPRLIDAVLDWAPRTVVAIGLTLALLYFLLASGNLFVHKLVRVAPTLADKKRAVEIVHSIKQEISRYILTITLINIGLGVAIGLTMWLLGMPNAALWGAMATVFNFVPYLGAITGVAVVSIVALVSFEAIGHVLLVGGSYAVLTALEGNLITPSILGRRLPLNAVVIFIGLIFWAWIWGIPGAFLAAPILATIKIVCDRVEQLTPIGEFLGR
jgi:predicted PurR-regulated permease PerM